MATFPVDTFPSAACPVAMFMVGTFLKATRLVATFVFAVATFLVLLSRWLLAFQLHLRLFWGESLDSIGRKPEGWSRVISRQMKILKVFGRSLKIPEQKLNISDLYA